MNAATPETKEEQLDKRAQLEKYMADPKRTLTEVAQVLALLRGLVEREEVGYRWAEKIANMAAKLTFELTWLAMNQLNGAEMQNRGSVPV